MFSSCLIEESKPDAGSLKFSVSGLLMQPQRFFVAEDLIRRQCWWLGPNYSFRGTRLNSQLVCEGEMIYGTSEKPFGCRMMEVRGPARLRDMVDRQTVRGKNSHCGAGGK